ncbi:hypothetical protein FEM08_03990 [Flavobacterium gilvum]|nr:hypothetical protein FEM08_03990 [Flavobacterium gilvum]
MEYSIEVSFDKQFRIKIQKEDKSSTSKKHQTPIFVFL